MTRVNATKSSPAKPGAKPAAKPGAKAPGRPGARKRPGGNGGLVTLGVIVLTAIAVTALPLGILFTAGLLPTAVAIIVDRHRRRYLARTVGALNLAGVLPGALRVWETGISFASLEQVISRPFTWLVMYGAAGLGWLLFFGMPPLVGMIVDVRVDDQKRRLAVRAKALVEEWGEEVTGRRRPE